MAGVLYQVMGPAAIFVNGAILGSSSNQFLGICRERIRIAITEYDEPIRSGNAGPNIPADVQYFGKDATISGTLAEYDPAVVAAIESLTEASPGNLQTIGAPMYAGGLTFALKIPSPSPYSQLPWTFPVCKRRRLADASGTEYTLIDFEFYAFAPFKASLTGEISALFTRSFS